ncbi:hypothetical protein HanXRQr2_Chr09g0412071 [Helianthus annuus]|uniref:Uncharacterized protein n=1 Tax=Helianthus annuus TaxID=4232 RepID=A0A9K3IA83_HELAN|nr:hypothetical protein HanXRQr2_Chr09g0412071 [Helianthus annuus]
MASAMICAGSCQEMGSGNKETWSELKPKNPTYFLCLDSDLD